ncbi:hypothetical protein DFQ26_000968 [Actinomortierella ambigua]|nr:hypothetical protein DFQ26_000968 [Actinomortierella ambigua]
MPKVLYRFPTGEGLVHLLNPSLFEHVEEEALDSVKSSSSPPPPAQPSGKGTVAVAQGPRLKIQAVHHTPGVGLNGISNMSPSLASVAQALARFRFYQLVCDFDETITEHDTTSLLDELRRHLYDAHHHQPSSPPPVPAPPPPTPLSPPAPLNSGGHHQDDSNDQQYFSLTPTATQKSHPPPAPRWTWDEILGAYLDDLTNVHVGDLDHLHCDREVSKECRSSGKGGDNNNNNGGDSELETSRQAMLFETVQQQQQASDPCLTPWFETQVRRRIAEEVSMRRVHDSGNLAGLTAAQIRTFARSRARLRPGLVELLAARVELSAGKEGRSSQGRRGEGEDQKEEEEEEGEEEEAGEGEGSAFWILSVNWSQDLIRGAMDQVFEHPEVTDQVLPPSRLVCSNLEFHHHHHHNGDNQQHYELQTQQQPHDQHEHALSISTGRVHIRCLTGCDKLRAFRTMQADYAAQQGLTLLDTQWAFLGDSINDLGCLVEADLGIIIGTSNSLLAECERLGIQIVDVQVVQNTE